MALEILIILYKYDVAKERMDLVLELQTQLQERKVSIGVYGRHSIGKTTLLNALLWNRYGTLLSYTTFMVALERKNSAHAVLVVTDGIMVISSTSLSVCRENKIIPKLLQQQTP